jgi:GH25 family lysozyme M1 (1,4-beta-N-acetylmuramidase)
MVHNPPTPAGYKLVSQLSVTPEMTQWAVAILHDPAEYPLFKVALNEFGSRKILARVEWHDPDFNNHVTHRGVTLYEPVPVPTAAPSSGPQAAPLTLGIDVSGYQTNVDWAQVQASGICFAFVKATESETFVDHQFAAHWSGAKQAGLLRGAYHFFRPNHNAQAQARLFLAQVRDPGELPPVLDVETMDGVSGAQVTAGVKAWLEAVTPVLGRPIIYTTPGFWNALPVMAGIADKADLWVAHWGAPSPAAVKGLPHWKFWQHTNHAAIAGIPGHAAVDEDRFNGSLSDLQAYSQNFVAARPAA